jgi:2-oxoglutarate-Fe(II)-dependent oxygenase superfamily protein
MPNGCRIQPGGRAENKILFGTTDFSPCAVRRQGAIGMISASVRIVNQAYAMVDDFLGPDDHLALWDAFQEAVRSPAEAGDWNRVYQRADGEPAANSEHELAEPLLRDVTIGGSMGPQSLRRFSEKLFGLVTGERPPLLLDPWTGLSLAPWVYRPGGGLEWHSDTGWLAGYIYYMHPVWRSSWGGELLVAASDPASPRAPLATPSSAGDSRIDVEAVCRTGGAFIYPRPNRLVLLRGGTLHCVKRVESAAGKAFRASLSGFFFNTDAAQTPG